jgi:3-oxoacyl-[acyl-carrier protein] reductase
MDFGLQGKIAMVAAASKGIGFATAQELIAEGCQLSICSRNEEDLERAVGLLGGDARSYCVDVSSPEDLAWWVSETKKDLGAPDILVTNTGGPPAGPAKEMTDEQWQAGIDSTLMNVVRLTRLVREDMISKGWGRIVHVTSLVAKEPSDMLPISSTIRTGLMALTRLQATELAANGITVNAVLPGNTLTDRQKHLIEITATKESITEEEALQRKTASIPMQRMAEPQEIAAAIAFLCSQRAAYVTGINMLVDGGVTKTFV